MARSVLRATQPVEQFFQLSLTGLLASGYLALAGSGQLDLPTTVLTGAGLLLRLLVVSGTVRLDIPPVWATAGTLIYIGFYPLDVLYVSREFIPATVHLICFLAVTRALTARTNRDYFFVKLLAFLEILAATLISTSLNFFVFLTLFVVFGVATFACSEIRRSAEAQHRLVARNTPGFGRSLSALTAAVVLSIFLMTAGLFFLLPRTARAALRSVVSERYHLPGFSDEVTLGQIGELKNSSTPVMHVRIDPPHEKAQLKWRGAALTQFDGKRWYNPKSIPRVVTLERGWTLLADAQRARRGPHVIYTVRIGSIDSDNLFFAEIPESVAMRGLRAILRKPGDTFTTGLGYHENREYMASSLLPGAEHQPEQLTEQAFNEHLLLPPVGQRIISIAREAAGTGTPEERALAIERYLRSRYGYTTELEKELMSNPLEHFLVERRRGHCEYFASAMAVMLRVSHIPSRVVTGFQSGTYNPMTGWHVIRASDAHSWVEAWLPNRGWTTFDPTPPDDTQKRWLHASLSRLMLYMDTAETLWRQWIINYNIDQQFDLMSRMERRGRMLNTQWLPEFIENVRRAGRGAVQVATPYALPGVLAVLASGAVTFFLPRALNAWKRRRDAERIARGQVAPTDAAILYGRMLDSLRSRGLEKPSWLTPGEFARIVPDSPVAPLVEQITAAYHELRYGNAPQAGPRMVQLLQELESIR